MIFGIEMLEALGGMLSLECDVDRMDVDMTEETTDFGPIGTTVTVCPTHLVLAEWTSPSFEFRITFFGHSVGLP